jgi:RNA polymerase primary sigma factor
MVDAGAMSQAAAEREPAADEVRDLVERGRETGALTTDDVAAAFGDADAAPELIDTVLAALAEQGIDVVEPSDDGDSSGPGPDRRGSERADGPAAGDPVRLYLREIGRVRLLTAPEEVDLAKRIEAGLFAAEKLASGGVVPLDLRDELALVTADGQRAKQRLV